MTLGTTETLVTEVAGANSFDNGAVYVWVYS